MHAHTLSVGTQRHKTRIQRVLMLFVLVFLALQLFGASSHKHAYTDSQNDCAACVIAHLPTGGTPPALVVAPVAQLVSVPVPVLQRSVRALRTDFLTPPSHAPPGVA
ncbi:MULTISPECIES: hypothetical protein [Duganella]|jgi:hypothetical protein|uniref:hypothetical protein n=1 Tax=Duganella TaxID=75654 RepID=UPI0017D7CE4A